MKKQEIESFLVSEDEVGLRLDKLLANHYKETKSRTYFEDLIEQGRVLVNGNPAKKRIFPNKGDFIEIDFLLTADIDLVGEDIPLSVVYEDESIIVINKPAGMVVHPAPGNWSGTLVNALLFHCSGLRDIIPTSIDEPLLRPGIVHRLDKDTSGIIIAAKNSLAHEKLVSMFANRTVKKEYLAICVGNPGNKTFSSNIERDPIRRKEMRATAEGGREAVTHCESIAFNGKLSFVRLKPITGRTHQLRVHLKHNRTPILGDPVYGSANVNQANRGPRLMLHARSIEFPHPLSGDLVRFEAEIPEDMTSFAQTLKALP